MSEQDGIQSSKKQRRSRKTNNDNHQSGKQAPSAQRPASDDTEAWKAYWKALGQPWRTEPEIDEERQKYLAERRSIRPDIEQGIYPFKEIKLSRADVEWLLSSHENGCGPVDWISERGLHERRGIDLRGADLREEDLRGLPLTCMQGGLEVLEPATDEQRNMAAVHLEKANLEATQLQGASLNWAQLQEAHLRWANLQQAHLRWAQLQGANLYGAQLQRANLRETHLQGTGLSGTELDGVRLHEATLIDEKYGPAKLADIRWGEVNLAVVDWTPVKMLGEEHRARLSKEVVDYRVAVRANRQLAVILRDQGLNEEADHFAYHAQLLQRMVFWYQHEFGRWLFSVLLALLSGYGYRIWRILAAYVVVVSLFALVYFVLGRYYPPHLPLHQAFLESITAFHGRVFLEQFNPDTPQIWFTALEAIAGLVVEGVFIAMLIQRFFGK